MALRITIDDEVVKTLAQKFGVPADRVWRILFEFGKDPQKVE